MATKPAEKGFSHKKLERNVSLLGLFALQRPGDPVPYTDHPLSETRSSHIRFARRYFGLFTERFVFLDKVGAS